MKPKKCLCGCGGIPSPGKSYIKNHHFKGKKHTKETKEVLREKRVEVLELQEAGKKPHRLHFPERGQDEPEGEYRWRKFEFFCTHYVTHIAGEYAGKPVDLMPWQKGILSKIFGTLDDRGRRQYRNLFIHVARKNGKTFMTCLIILYWLAEESFDDPAAEIVSCANTREQSIKTIFRTARIMVSYSKELRQLIQIGIQPPHLTNRLNNATYEPVAADAAPQLGRNLSLAVFDETHGQPNSELWDAITTSQSMRKQPLMVSISTAGDTRASFYYELYSQMKRIEADPTLDPRTLTAIYECPEERDWRDPNSFLLANPAVGVDGEGFRPIEELQVTLKRAIGGQGEQGYRQFYLNQFARFGARSFVPLHKWDACMVPSVDANILKNCRVVGGLDWSSRVDLTGFSLVFELKKNSPEWLIYTWAWLAGEDLSECSRRDKIPYERWINDEVVYFEGKPTIDIEAIMAVLGNLKDAFPNLRKVGYDPYLTSEMEPLSKFFRMEPVAQRYEFLSPATKLLQYKVLKGELKHEENPLLRACIENCKTLEDPSGNIRLDKSKSNSRIDPLAALVNAAYMGIKEWGIKIEPKEESK